MMYRLGEWLWFNAAWLLPRRLVEMAAIRCWANATSGPFGNESPVQVTMDDCLKRWRRREGGDRSFRAPKGLAW